MGAEMGKAVCQRALGELYAEGEGVPRNYSEAYKWFNLAAARPIALKNPQPFDLASYKEKKKTYRERRDEVAKRMSSTEIAEAQRLAREWKPKTWEEVKSLISIIPES